MVYNAIGLMSGSSLDGLDIAFVELTEIAGKWTYELKASACVPYTEEWKEKLKNASSMSVAQFLDLHTAYGRYLGAEVVQFIEAHQLFHKVHFIASHGHTAYHNPATQTSFQLGDGASIAAVSGLKVISDLRNKDVAYGGQGAPIVPMAEQLLWKEYDLCLNLGGIANLTVNHAPVIAFDICPCNQVLDYLAQKNGKTFDAEGNMAALGNVDTSILAQLENLDYYQINGPKSLANQYSQELITLLDKLEVNDALATASEHIATEISKHLQENTTTETKLLITGGGALNTFLIQKLVTKNPQLNIIVADEATIKFKEAIAMALLGALRWMEQDTVLASVTGAEKNSVGGALWLNDY